MYEFQAEAEEGSNFSRFNFIIAKNNVAHADI